MFPENYFYFLLVSEKKSTGMTDSEPEEVRTVAFPGVWGGG